MTSRLRFLLWYFAAWIPVATIYSVLIYLQSSDGSVIGAVIGGVESVLFAGVLGLPVWRMTSRLADRPRRATVVIGLHVAMALAYTLVWTSLIVLTIAVFAPKPVLASFLQFALGWELLTGILIYGMLAGIAHAVAVNARLRREREAATRAEALRARAELNVLRAQMNPHFLFNVLHSISALARTDPVAVEKALERLALLLRRVLDANRNASDYIALAEEWEIIRDQLELETLRFGDRLRVVTDVESDALECQIPIFILQPLVENALRHGVASRTQPSTVSISAKVRDDVLELQVADDGPGADPRLVAQAPGLGLRAIRQRLAAHYRDRAGVRIDTAPGAGFRVQVTLPAVIAAPLTTAERAVAAAPVGV